MVKSSRAIFRYLYPLLLSSKILRVIEVDVDKAIRVAEKELKVSAAEA